MPVTMSSSSQASPTLTARAWARSSRALLFPIAWLTAAPKASAGRATSSALTVDDGPVIWRRCTSTLTCCAHSTTSVRVSPMASTLRPLTSDTDRI